MITNAIAIILNINGTCLRYTLIVGDTPLNAPVDDIFSVGCTFLNFMIYQAMRGINKMSKNRYLGFANSISNVI
ncbi:hypothetical protein DCPSUM001_37200 [Dysgonomonas capnocytophagoides]|nr:hypothetical protein DCPSUM001_37200 [Dysgonomonas capnocytophagoides]